MRRFGLAAILCCLALPALAVPPTTPSDTDGVTIGGPTYPISIGGTIAAANVYQQVAAGRSANGLQVTISQCAHGGIIENTSTSGLMYVDWTSGIAAGGTTLSSGAAALGVASSTAAGGKQTIPPTNNPVFVYGPAGTTFRGSCS